jgi:peptidoglycan/xylan/chitin deacetylase (PgdA/CDA1 family)
MSADGTPRARSVVKTALAMALSWSRADALIGSLADTGGSSVVIGYHRVVEDFSSAARFSIPAMLISSRMLEEQLDWIGRRYRFVSLDELGRELDRGGAAGRPLAAVTFDDGYRDVHDVAMPVLARKGIPAAVFVVTDLVGTGRAQVHDRLYMLLCRASARWPDPATALRELLLDLDLSLPGLDLDRLAGDPRLAVATLLRSLSRCEVDRLAVAIEDAVGADRSMAAGIEPLSWEMLADMVRAGVIVGSHTRSHAWLTQESSIDVLDEARGSREEIERRLGITVEHFAYPDGRFDAATVTAVAAAGYRFGYTTCTHRDPRHPLLTLPRRMLWENSCVDAVHRFSPAIMSCQVHGIWNLVSSCGQNHGA